MKRKSANITLAGELRLKCGGKHFLGKGRIELLERIAKTGSIAKAARAMGMSYKAAWDAVDAMNNLADEPLLERVSGGRGGGGSLLTERGKEFLKVFRTIEKKHREFLDELCGDISSFLKRG